jgi:hypothetical protein
MIKLVVNNQLAKINKPSIITVNKIDESGYHVTYDKGGAVTITQTFIHYHLLIRFQQLTNSVLKYNVYNQSVNNSI